MIAITHTPADGTSIGVIPMLWTVATDEDQAMIAFCATESRRMSRNIVRPSAYSNVPQRPAAAP